MEPDSVPQLLPLRGLPGQLLIFFYLLLADWGFRLQGVGHLGYLRALRAYGTTAQLRAFSSRCDALDEMTNELDQH